MRCVTSLGDSTEGGECGFGSPDEYWDGVQDVAVSNATAPGPFFLAKRDTVPSRDARLPTSGMPPNLHSQYPMPRIALPIPRLLSCGCFSNEAIRA